MQISRRFRTLLGAFLVVALTLGIASTFVSAQEATPDDAAAESFPVSITFVNAMTSLGSVDVYINGDDSDQRVVEGLEYGTVSEAFNGTAPATGVVIKQNVNWGYDRYLFNTLVPTEAGKSYVVVISDFFIIPTEVDLSATGADAGRTRGVHAAAQAPAVDVYVTQAGAEFAIGNVVPLIVDLSYGNVTDGGLTPAGTYDLRLTATGTDTIALESPGLVVEAGQVYTLVIIGKPGSTEQPLTTLVVAMPAESAS